MFSSSIVSLALAASALANVYITNPVSSTTFQAGSSVTVNWQDDGNPPTLQQWGTMSLAVFVGNADEQIMVQTIATDVNAASVNSVTFTPNAQIGGNSGQYFIRATSDSLKDATNAQYPQEAFSAKFTMSGMTGSFNSTEQDAIDGQSTAPIGPTSTASAASSSSAASTGSASTLSTMSTMTTSSSSSSSSSSSASSTSSSPSASPSATSSSGAAKPIIATGFVGLVAVFIGASLL